MAGFMQVLPEKETKVHNCLVDDDEASHLKKADGI